MLGSVPSVNNDVIENRAEPSIERVKERYVHVCTRIDILDRSRSIGLDPGWYVYRSMGV